MRSISIRDDIEQVMLQYVRSVPDVFIPFDINKIQLMHDRDEFWDIVLVEDEDNEVIVGEVMLDADFKINVEIFEED